MNRMRWIGIGIGICIAAAMIFVGGLHAIAKAATVDPNDPIPFPTDYRSWALVKSALIGPAATRLFPTEGGLHHVYANPAAVEGFRTGKFADGAILVYELLNVQEKDGITTEGTRRRFDMMVKHQTRFAATSGWGFERFKDESQTPVLDVATRATCASCHQKQGTHELVISAFR